nr:hypothetical protein [Tanacetum cinerariifolium]
MMSDRNNKISSSRPLISVRHRTSSSRLTIERRKASSRETLAPLKSKGDTLQDVCAHFHHRFDALEVFNWTQPDSEVLR